MTFAERSCRKKLPKEVAERSSVGEETKERPERKKVSKKHATRKEMKRNVEVKVHSVGFGWNLFDLEGIDEEVGQNILQIQIKTKLLK